KMYWFAGMPDRNGVPLLPSSPNVVNATPSCQQQVQIRFDQVPADDAAPPPNDAAIVLYRHELGQMVGQAQGDLVGSHLNAVFVRLFGDSCDSVIQKVALSAGNVFNITYDVSPRCLQAELNYALSRVHVTGQMGTGNGTVCHLVSTLTDADANW